MHVEYTDKKKLSRREIDALMLTSFRGVTKGNITLNAKNRKYYVIQVSYDRRLYPNAVYNWVIEQFRDHRNKLISRAYTSIANLNGLIDPCSPNGHLFKQLLCCDGKIAEEYACKYSLESFCNNIDKLNEYLTLLTRLVNAGIVV